jgi:hypothetical protein
LGINSAAATDGALSLFDAQDVHDIAPHTRVATITHDNTVFIVDFTVEIFIVLLMSFKKGGAKIGILFELCKIFGKKSVES